MAKGTRIGGIQRWRYLPGRWSEKKVGRDRQGRGIWKGVYQVDKIQNRQGRFPKGGKITWHIEGKQHVQKLKGHKNRYRTRFVFTKSLKKLDIPRKGFRRRRRSR